MARGKGEEVRAWEGPTGESKTAEATHSQGLRSFLQTPERLQSLWGDVATGTSAYLIEQFHLLQGALQDGVQGQRGRPLRPVGSWEEHSCKRQRNELPGLCAWPPLRGPSPPASPGSDRLEAVVATQRER